MDDFYSSTYVHNMLSKFGIIAIKYDDVDSVTMRRQLGVFRCACANCKHGSMFRRSPRLARKISYVNVITSSKRGLALNVSIFATIFSNDFVQHSSKSQFPVINAENVAKNYVVRRHQGKFPPTFHIHGGDILRSSAQISIIICFENGYFQSRLKSSLDIYLDTTFPVTVSTYTYSYYSPVKILSRAENCCMTATDLSGMRKSMGVWCMCNERFSIWYFYLKNCRKFIYTGWAKSLFTWAPLEQFFAVSSENTDFPKK